MLKKHLTIDDLAAMVKRGFDETATSDDVRRVEHRLDGLEQKVGGLEKNVGGLEHKVEEGFQRINARLDTIRADIGDLPVLREAVHALHLRVVRLEKKAALTR